MDTTEQTEKRDNTLLNSKAKTVPLSTLRNLQTSPKRVDIDYPDHEILKESAAELQTASASLVTLPIRHDRESRELELKRINAQLQEQIDILMQQNQKLYASLEINQKPIPIAVLRSQSTKSKKSLPAEEHQRPRTESERGESSALNKLHKYHNNPELAALHMEFLRGPPLPTPPIPAVPITGDCKKDCFSATKISPEKRISPPINDIPTPPSPKSIKLKVKNFFTLKNSK
ncbi:UNVERIFIED_CONTAM: hypothetical protein HDU68_012871 [Siphonaria sp. JEL0065]|nr:hypothetical protein HDU68_012871 [Siphonaria sp. JEL0065]